MLSLSHPIEDLNFPDRYEKLIDVLQDDIARLLVAPPPESIKVIEGIAQEVRSRSEGILVPVWGQSGSGKTTFVMNASYWTPKLFTQTLSYQDEISYDSLTEALREFSSKLPADNSRIIPINVDHRENDPPSNKELSAIKRFLRTNGANVPSVIFWPETNADIAASIAKTYIEICGEPAVDLPLRYSGPHKSSWQDIASATLLYANKIDSLENLGVDPKNYDPIQFHALGKFLRKIQQDFNKRVQEYKAELNKPVSLLIVFASESTEPGILTQLTNASRYTLLDAQALISVTSQSLLGKWWAERRGLLTRAIVQLNARAIALPPSATMSCIGAFGDGDWSEYEKIGYGRRQRFNVLRTLLTTDFGKLLCGKHIHRFEARGRAADKAEQAFTILANRGFNLGSDKGLNRILADALIKMFEQEKISVQSIKAETQLPISKSIPDILIDYKDQYVCIELTWRKGNFLSSQNRATVAQYILQKLQTYVRQLGWTSD